MTGVERIAAERQRQVEVEGWTPEHDREHGDSGGSNLVWAALAYLCPAGTYSQLWGDRARLWPWEEGFYKPTPNDRIRELVKAGALIAAEIDRLSAGQEEGTT